MKDLNKAPDDDRRDDLKWFVYWLPPTDFDGAREQLSAQGYRLSPARLTPCQVLKARGRKLVFATPERWNGQCKRQGSWYRGSPRRGQYMLVSDHELTGAIARRLDVTIEKSDFTPESLPSRAELDELVNTPDYQQAKPPGWERITRLDSVFLKLFMSATRFWGIGEGLRTHWLGHRANHANFLTRRFSTQRGAERVAYSVTDNASVCSSCVQFFNLMTPDERKLVRACPGSVAFASVERDVYYDVQVSAPPRTDQT